MFIRKCIFLAGLTLCFAVAGHTQTVTSTRDGLWTDPSVWDMGQVPTLATASEIVIDHAVTIPPASFITIRNAVVNNSLTVATGAICDLVPDELPEKKDLQVFGVLRMEDGGTLNGTAVSNTSFESGSRYVHRQGPLGFIPYATWHSNSTFEIAGFKTQGYINIAHSDSWKQNFGHVIYNCAQQTTAFVDLNGYLRNIAGNFIIQSTNGQALRLSTTQNSVISIGGDFIIEGPSRIWFSTSPTAGSCNIGGNFIYRSASAGISYLTTKGVMGINVLGNFEVNTPGRIHMASTSLDSTGMRQTTLSLHNNVSIVAGLVVGPPLPAKGKINFSGLGVQIFNAPSTTTFQGSIDYSIGPASTLNLGRSFLSNAAGNLTVQGTLQLGSTHPQGALQLSSNGNVRTQGTRTFETGATIEYNGMAEQWLGNGHPASSGVNLICSNPDGVTLLNQIVARDMTFTGKFDTQQFPLTAYGDVLIAPAIEFEADHLNLRGGAEQVFSASGAILPKLIINKVGGGVALTSPLNISNTVRIESSNTMLASNGFLSLLSVSDGVVGTAGVGPLPSGSSITGNVTVERWMSAEGRIYRYISSPVQNATVASLKDDFPITGTFQDPSTGPGIKSANPSFFQYNEAIGDLQAGWRPYPVSGISSANPLVIGRGYCAYMWRGGVPITWDVTGQLNQGMIEIPVAFTDNGEPSNGWNLVGNPYPSAIQWNDMVKGEWTTDRVSSIIAVRDNGAGTFKYWDIDDGGTNASDGEIALGQAFWIRTTAENPRLTIRENVKASGGAAFLRADKTSLPGFQVQLSRDVMTDIASYKVKPASNPFLDNGDGLKLDNDFFDLSIISSDRHSLAIHATDKFPCDTTITLGIKDVSAGNYTLSVRTTPEFSRYQYTLYDNYTGIPLLLGEEGVTISITSDARSYAFDRLSIHLRENVPETEQQIIAKSMACIGSVIKLTIRDAESSVVYSAWSGLRKLSETRADRSGDVEIHFNTDSLAPGSHRLSFKAQSSCHISTLHYVHPILIMSAPEVLILADTACAGSTATLTAFSNQRDVSFHWFDDVDSQDTLQIGYSFETPPLLKSRSYYLSASTKFGCSSERVPVSTVVTAFREASISIQGDSLLSSNYTTGNQWFRNDELIESSSGIDLELESSGVYTLRVDTLGCETKDTLTYVISKIETAPISPFAYPNPASNVIYIKGDVGIQNIEIWNAVGQLVLTCSPGSNGSDIAVPIGELAAGVYTAVIFTQQRKWVFRFVKSAG